MADTPDIEALYAQHGRAVLGFLVRRTGDTHAALDLWAETFAVAWMSRTRFRGNSPGQAEAWVYGIARKQLAHYHRRGAAQQRALHRLGLERPPADAELLAEIERDAQLGELRAMLGQALAALSEPNRQAVQLRVVDELPYQEVARRLNISEQTARARVSRSLSALAATLEQSPALEAL